MPAMGVGVFPVQECLIPAAPEVLPLSTVEQPRLPEEIAMDNTGDTLPCCRQDSRGKTKDVLENCRLCGWINILLPNYEHQERKS